MKHKMTMEDMGNQDQLFCTECTYCVYKKYSKKLLQNGQYYCPICGIELVDYDTYLKTHKGRQQ